MKLNAELRIWIWIIVVPIVAVALLAIALREARQYADAPPSTAARERADAQAEAEADQQAEAERRMQAQQQADAVQACGRLVRPMLNRPHTGPLLMVVTAETCTEGCPRLQFADRLMDEYALRGLGGVWVTVQSHPPAAGQGPAPAMAEVVVSQCGGVLRAREEFWALFDGGGATLALQPLDTPDEAPLADELQSLRAAVRMAIYGR